MRYKESVNIKKIEEIKRVLTIQSDFLHLNFFEKEGLLMSNVRANLWFMFSIALNALGNSFMIAANLGSAPWTSAGQNLASILPISIGLCIILLNFGAFVVSYMMKTRLTLLTIIKSMGLAFVFGLCIDLFVSLHHLIFIPDNMVLRFLYLLVGINFVAAAVCIYFQLHSVYLPCDYLLKAFAKLKQNYTVGTIFCMSIPLSISMLIFLFQHHLTGLGIGTILFIFGLGFLIDRYNYLIVINKSLNANSHI
jgi:uncharacterized protein